MLNDFRPLWLSLELPGTFHDIRHTHATELLRMGVHPKIVSERHSGPHQHRSLSIPIAMCYQTCKEASLSNLMMP